MTVNCASIGADRLFTRPRPISVTRRHHREWLFEALADDAVDAATGGSGDSVMAARAQDGDGFRADQPVPPMTTILICPPLSMQAIPKRE
jgi:hypothetical protein